MYFSLNVFLNLSCWFSYTNIHTELLSLFIRFKNKSAFFFNECNQILIFYFLQNSNKKLYENMLLNLFTFCSIVYAWNLACLFLFTFSHFLCMKFKLLLLALILIIKFYLEGMFCISCFQNKICSSKITCCLSWRSKNSFKYFLPIKEKKKEKKEMQNLGNISIFKMKFGWLVGW